MTHGSEKRARTSHITIRLTTDERATIDDDASRAGLTAGSYARGVLLRAPAPRQVRRPPIERRELVRLLGQLGHVGSNINQIARAANVGEPPEYEELADALSGLSRLRAAILAALGRDP